MKTRFFRGSNQRDQLREPTGHEVWSDIYGLSVYGLSVHGPVARTFLYCPVTRARMPMYEQLLLVLLRPNAASAFTFHSALSSDKIVVRNMHSGANLSEL